ncbi:MAG TPA: putative quinol monooxygenase [Gammaproteobacteria bacterium]|nr:putative quinol monooxygenase [Gammaproteobacteria bacterium]
MTQNIPCTVVVTFEAKPGKEKMLHDLLYGLIAPCLKENGCLNYDFHNSPDNPAKFMFHETWTTKAALDKHSQSPHIQAAVAKIGDMLATPIEMTVWKKI